MDARSPHLDPQAVARALGGQATGYNVRAPAPNEGPQGRSLSITLDPNAPDGFRLHNHYDAGDWRSCRDHVKAKLNIPAWSPPKGATTSRRLFGDVKQQATKQPDQPKPFNDRKLVQDGYTQTAVYGYAVGDQLLYEVLRYDHPTKDKTFLNRSPDGQGGWFLGAGDRKVLYRGNDLHKVAHDTVFVTEGEKDADRLAALGFVAVTVASGKWSEEALRALTGYECLILEDNDDPGRKRAQKAAAALHGIARCVRIVSLPGLPEKGDVSDWLDAGNDHNRLIDIATSAPLWTPETEAEPEPEKEPKEHALPFVGFEDLRVETKKAWLLKYAFALGETSSLVGGPGKGKSGLATDISVHVAAGRDWRGYKSKGRFAVIYLACERGDLLKRRLEAYKRKYGLKDLPLVVVTAPVDIMQAACIPVLVETIKAVVEHYGVRAGLLILDTFAKAIALGGGDEDKAKDQNKALGHLRLVQQETGVHVLLVGHTGKDETRGARGSNAHLGDVDLMVQFSGDKAKTALVTKANDQPEGPLTIFTLEPFEFGHDEDGDPITTAIVSDVVPDKEAKGSSSKRQAY